jgi:hypothetical protein
MVLAGLMLALTLAVARLDHRQAGVSAAMPVPVVLPGAGASVMHQSVAVMLNRTPETS